jgi:hypothetical protein
MSRLIPPASARASATADAPVTWTGGPPSDDDALAVWHALHEDHATTYAALVERTGERLFRRDLAQFGAAADVGFFRPFYGALARQIIAALAGTILQIGAPE